MSAAGAFGTRLTEAGLDLIGALSTAEFDALVPASWQTAELHPTAAQWIVIASGGRGLTAATPAGPVRWAPIAPIPARPKPTTTGLRLPGFVPNRCPAALSAQPDSPADRNGTRRQGRRYGELAAQLPSQHGVGAPRGVLASAG